MLREIKRSIVDSPQSIVKKTKTIILCLLSSILLILSFNNGNLWFLAWVGFVPFFFAIKNKSKIKSFLLAYLTGVIFWLGTIYWLIHVTLIGMIVLVLYLALYFGIFGLIISYFVILRESAGSRFCPDVTSGQNDKFEVFRSSFYITQLVILPSIWVILEYIRGHLFPSFPWAILAYSQYTNLPVIQIADIFGAWVVSFLIIMVNYAIYLIISCIPLSAGERVKGERDNRKKISITVISVLVIVLSYGYYKLFFAGRIEGQKSASICVVQPNIPQELKWDIKAKDFIISEYLNLTKQAVKTSPDLIIWPEAALPTIPQEDQESFSKIELFVKQINTELLLGAVTIEEDNYYNSAVLLSSGGSVVEQYNKIHLVPFGEYLPLRGKLGFLEALVPIEDFTKGQEYTIFNLDRERVKGEGNINFAVLICFEDVFPELAREFVRKGAGFLVNISNDAWFKDTSEPYQHMQASVFRAVENRVFVVRCANTGVSAFISPSGKIISQVHDITGKGTYVKGVAAEKVFAPTGQLSFYTRKGDIFILLCLILILINVRLMNSKFISLGGSFRRKN
ncbi:MAG: apolipoprotein N-acyltransferase [Candidatus Omnitrophota bacterium]